jgi:superfamily II DNA or RNA helicase
VSRREVPPGSLVVLDEAHHYVADLWQDIPAAYPDAFVLGATATPERADGRGLGDVFNGLVVAAQISELQAAGHLVRSTWIGPRHMLGKNQIAQEPWAAWVEHAKDTSAIVFAPHVKAAEDYARDFREHVGNVCEIVTGTTPKIERDAILGQLASGACKVVINVGVLTEGFDCPRVKCIVIARGVGSVGAYIQMAGRALRPWGGATEAVILDLRGVANVLGLPDEDRLYSLEGLGIQRTAIAPAAAVRLCRVCGVPLGDATTCPECGNSHELVTPHATGDPMSAWRDRYEAAKLQLRPNRTSLALASIYRKSEEAARDGRAWKPGAVLHRFRAIFKRIPDNATQLMAREINRLSAEDISHLEKWAEK